MKQTIDSLFHFDLDKS